MPVMPAYCSNCRKWVPSGLYLEEDVEDIAFEHCFTTCESCGGTATIFNGIYKTVGDALEIIKSYDLTVKEIMALTRILQQAVRLNTPAGQIRDLIAREVPRASSLNKLIVDNPGLVFVVASILAALQIIVPLLLTSNSNQIDTERVIKAILESKTQSEPATKKKVKDGVNAPCWCGSNKKRKKCHGLKANPNLISNLNQKPK